MEKRTKIQEALKLLSKDVTYTRSQIEKVLKEAGIEKFQNITSMTYNRWNQGMEDGNILPLFEYLGHNSYRYLGEDFPYTGDLFNKLKCKNGQAIKIGYWINGVLFDFDGNLSSYKFNINNFSGYAPVHKPFTSSENGIKELIGIGWFKIGEYVNSKNGIICKAESNVNKNERISLVYILVLNSLEIKYIGKTVQGYVRPLTYHKNTVMNNVKEGIEEEIKRGNKVEIFVKRFESEDFILWHNLPLNIVEAVEQALISKYLPEWNRYRHKP